jgi:hypothetical protein
MSDYEVSRPIGKCSVTGRVFSEGESFFSALFETPQGFERRDFAADEWHGAPDGALCHFQTRLPKRDEPKRTFVDDEALISFFLALAKSEEAIKIQFRFVLSLILMRKRLVKYERTIREGDAEWWEVRLMRDKSTHRVMNPSLAEHEIHNLTQELQVVLAGRADDSAMTLDESDASEAAADPVQASDA